jgi:hypothetical protein
MIVIGGALNKKFKPILDEFKRWRLVLGEPYEQYKLGGDGQIFNRSKGFNP